MLFFVIIIIILFLSLEVSAFLSPATESLMSRIWEDPTQKMKVKIAKRIKELCIDGDVPDETAILMVSKENGVMEDQIRNMMESAIADPTIMRIAFGSRIGGYVIKSLKRFGALEG